VFKSKYLSYEKTIKDRGSGFCLLAASYVFKDNFTNN